MSCLLKVPGPVCAPHEPLWEIGCLVARWEKLGPSPISMRNARRTLRVCPLYPSAPAPLPEERGGTDVNSGLKVFLNAPGDLSRRNKLDCRSNLCLPLLSIRLFQGVPWYIRRMRFSTFVHFLSAPPPVGGVAFRLTSQHEHSKQAP